MGFKNSEVEELLVATGRECSICPARHQVAVHHIVPPNKGGTDDIANAIPLCPSCHDAVHGSSALGRTSRAYTPEELRGFRQAKVKAVAQRRRGGSGQGGAGAEADAGAGVRERAPLRGRDEEAFDAELGDF